jgi:hypothetical protein
VYEVKVEGVGRMQPARKTNVDWDTARRRRVNCGLVIVVVFGFV